MYNKFNQSQGLNELINFDKMKKDKQDLENFKTPEGAAVLGSTTDKTSGEIKTIEDAQSVLPKKENGVDWSKLAQTLGDSADASSQIASRPIPKADYGDVGRGVEIGDAMAARRAALQKFLGR